MHKCIENNHLECRGAKACAAGCTSFLPARSSRKKAFSVALGVRTLPNIVVRPMISTNSGELNAQAMAIASSIPGSVSMINRFLLGMLLSMKSDQIVSDPHEGVQRQSSVPFSVHLIGHFQSCD